MEIAIRQHGIVTVGKGHNRVPSFTVRNNGWFSLDYHARFHPGALLNAIGMGAPRERREQIQDLSTVTLRYDGHRWFIRPAASLSYYDMMTDVIKVTGYQNH